MQLLTSLGIKATIVVDIGVAKRAACHSITADTDGHDWSNLHYRHISCDRTVMSCLSTREALLQAQMWS